MACEAVGSDAGRQPSQQSHLLSDPSRWRVLEWIVGLRPVLVKSQRDLAVFQARLGPWRFEVKGYVARVSDEIDLVCVKLMRVRGVPSRNDRMTKVFADQQ